MEISKGVAPSASPRPRLTESASFLLDVVRFSAALMVVAAHAGHPEFHTGYPDYQILGDIAVPMFFVLSGFIIRYVTKIRVHTAKEFFIDRASRMYSVVLPAMAITISISLICYRIAPGYYNSNFQGFSDHPAVRILLNLLFLSQSWGHNTIPFINSPFWSLGFECLYYVAFGIMLFCKGGLRVAALLTLSLVAGPQIVCLFPIWFLGCWIYDLYQAIRGTAAAQVIRCLTCIWIAAGLVMAAAGRNMLLVFPARLLLWFNAQPNPLLRVHVNPQRATTFAVGAGLIAAVGILLLLLLSDWITLPGKHRLTTGFRRVAEGTFAIYLMHYPVMVLCAVLGLFSPLRPYVNLVVLVSVCVLLTWCSGPLDILKSTMRRSLRSLLAV